MQDTLASIERVAGSAFADALRGNAGENMLEGGGTRGPEVTLDEPTPATPFLQAKQGKSDY